MKIKQTVGPDPLFSLSKSEKLKWNIQTNLVISILENDHNFTAAPIGPQLERRWNCFIV